MKKILFNSEKGNILYICSSIVFIESEKKYILDNTITIFVSYNDNNENVLKLEEILVENIPGDYNNNDHKYLYINNEFILNPDYTG